MAQIITKFIADLAVTEAKIANGAVTVNKIGAAAVTDVKLHASAKQSVLESKLVCSRDAITGLLGDGTSSLDVTGAVQGVSPVGSLTPQTVESAGKGVYVGSLTGATDWRKVQIRISGTDNGLDDGTGDEVYGHLTGTSGSYTLSFKTVAGGAYSLTSGFAVDAFFLETFDYYNAPIGLGMLPVAGVIDATSSSAITNHINSLTAHTASHLVYNRTVGAIKNVAVNPTTIQLAIDNIDDVIGTISSLAPTYYTASGATVVGQFQGIDTAIGAALSAGSGALTAHINNPTGAHAGTAVSYSATKYNVQVGSIDVTTAIADVDAAVGTISSLSPTNYTASGATAVGHFEGINTQIGILQGEINGLDGSAVKSVNSVFPIAGAVTIYTDDISEDGSPTNLWFTTNRARTAAVVNSTAGSETDQAPSVSAVNAAISAAVAGLQGFDCISYSSGTGFSVDFSTTGGLSSTNPGNANGQIQINTDTTNKTTKINATNQLEGLKPVTEVLTMTSGMISNQYFDLAHEATVGSIMLNPKSGPMQVPGVDFTISYTGGLAGVTRITLAGDLATAGNAALVENDVLILNYMYL